MVRDEAAGHFSPQMGGLSKIGDARQGRPVCAAGTEARCPDGRETCENYEEEEAKMGRRQCVEQREGSSEARTIQGGGGGEGEAGGKGGSGP